MTVQCRFRDANNVDLTGGGSRHPTRKHQHDIGLPLIPTRSRSPGRSVCRAHQGVRRRRSVGDVFERREERYMVSFVKVGFPLLPRSRPPGSRISNAVPAGSSPILVHAQYVLHPRISQRHRVAGRSHSSKHALLHGIIYSPFPPTTNSSSVKANKSPEPLGSKPRPNPLQRPHVLHPLPLHRRLRHPRQGRRNPALRLRRRHSQLRRSPPRKSRIIRHFQPHHPRFQDQIYD